MLRLQTVWGLVRGLTLVAALGGLTPVWAGGPRLLYAPAESDDPTYRNLIAEHIGGTCDYFDARSGTPEPSVLAEYDCVHTWSSQPYNDPVRFGDRLADYADAGGTVILGATVSSQTGNLLLGRITEPGYSPVTSLGARDQQSAWDGTCRDDCVWTNIPGVFAVHRAIGTTADPVNATVCGRYVDGEVAVAFNPDRSVAFVNGAAAFPYALDPYMAQLVGNVCMCVAGPAPAGACCLSDDSCVLLTSSDCSLQSGLYLGDDSVCEPNPCPGDEHGACCFADGTCIVETTEGCVSAEGAPQGSGTTCDPNPCEVPVLAVCCRDDGTCTVETEADCMADGGIFFAGTDSCNPNPCPPVSVHFRSWGSIKAQWSNGSP